MNDSIERGYGYLPIYPRYVDSPPLCEICGKDSEDCECIDVTKARKSVRDYCKEALEAFRRGDVAGADRKWEDANELLVKIERQLEREAAR